VKAAWALAGCEQLGGVLGTLAVEVAGERLDHGEVPVRLGASPWRSSSEGEEDQQFIDELDALMEKFLKPLAFPADD
jgi:hypothetical protein